MCCDANMAMVIPQAETPRTCSPTLVKLCKHHLLLSFSCHLHHMDVHETRVFGHAEATFPYQASPKDFAL